VNNLTHKENGLSGNMGGRGGGVGWDGEKFSNFSSLTGMPLCSEEMGGKAAFQSAHITQVLLAQFLSSMPCCQHAVKGIGIVD
jgi:hypothetical protein